MIYTVKVNGSLEIPVLADNYTEAVQQVFRIWFDATRDAIRP